MEKDTVVKKLPEGKFLDYSKPLAKQIESYIENLKNREYVLFNIMNFVHLQSYENQTDKNHIVIERQNSEYVVFDNVSFIEEHKNRYTDCKDVAQYVGTLLSQQTVLDYAQCRSVARFGLQFGDDVIVHRPSKTPVHGKIISYQEANPDEIGKMENYYHANLYFRPYKKDKTLSSVKPRMVYGNFTLEKC